jgi:tRNA dimethylallyltransferase
MTAALPKVFLLAGPTCSGKTALALEIAAQLPVEIISVDSTQVYRGLDIGAAKPSAELRARVPHHLLDIRDPSDPYDAGAFVSDAVRLAAEISARGRWPLLVGGTMLYFRALLQGLATLPAANSAVRAQLDAEAIFKGWPALHAELAQIDSAAAARIHPNDPQRIQRALEVYRVSGKPISVWQQESTRPAPVQVLRRWVLMPVDRAQLHARIAERFEQMLHAGFVDEVRQLRERGDLHADLPAIRSVGYRQFWQLLSDHPRPDTEQVAAALQESIAATRQLARRQMTWINADPDWLRLPVNGAADIPRLACELAHDMAASGTPC